MLFSGLESRAGTVPPEAESERFSTVKFLAGEFCVAEKYILEPIDNII
jgi:hypothetical protein